MMTFQTNISRNGFEITERSRGGREIVLSRHPTREMAEHWKSEHLRLLALDDLMSWLGRDAARPSRTSPRETLIKSTICAVLVGTTVATFGGWIWAAMWLLGII